MTPILKYHLSQLPTFVQKQKLKRNNNKNCSRCFGVRCIKVSVSDRQQSARLRKLPKSAISLHPSVRPYGAFVRPAWGLDKATVLVPTRLLADFFIESPEDVLDVGQTLFVRQEQQQSPTTRSNISNFSRHWQCCGAGRSPFEGPAPALA